MRNRSKARCSSKDRGDVLAVIGAGCWGTTLAFVFASSFHRVLLLTEDAYTCEQLNRFHVNEEYLGDFSVPRNVFATASLERAVDGAEYVVVAVPSSACRQMARSLKAALRGRTTVIIASKGLEPGTGLLCIEVFREELGASPRFAPADPLVLSGPNLAREICAGSPAVSVIAGVDRRSVRRAVARLGGGVLTLVGHPDPLGVQAAGALKNVYAIGCGAAAELGWGDNVKAAIVWRGLMETAEFGTALGGDGSALLTPAGVGDFVATCFSPLSRNHDLGRVVAGRSGERSDVRGVREGALTAVEALRRARSLGLRLRLLEAVCGVLSGREQPGAILGAAFATLSTAGRERHEGRPAPGTVLDFDPAVTL